MTLLTGLFGLMSALLPESFQFSPRPRLPTPRKATKITQVDRDHLAAAQAKRARKAQQRVPHGR